MTEAEWLNCTDPDRMWRFLAGRPAAGGLLGWLRGRPEPPPLPAERLRKLRLFACACCRHIADLMDDERSNRAVEVAERHADGRASEAERATASEAALDAYDALLGRGKAFTLPAPYLPHPEPTRAWVLAARAAAQVAGYPVEEVVATAVSAAMAVAVEWHNPAWAAQTLGDAARTVLLRDIFGNPFHDIRIDPAWLRWNDGTIPRMARAMYDAYDFADMPILHDALLDAGCDDEAILAHCREPGEHVRGCWLIDRVCVPASGA